MEEAKPVQPREVVPEQPSARPIPPQWEETVRVEAKVVPLAKPSVNYVPIPGVTLARTSATPIPPQKEIRPVETKQKETKNSQHKQRQRFTKKY